MVLGLIIIGTKIVIIPLDQTNQVLEGHQTMLAKVQKLVGNITEAGVSLGQTVTMIINVPIVESSVTRF